MRTSTRAALLAALVGLAGCGGGGGGGSPPPPPPGGITWTQGSFANSSTLENRCAVRRTGVDAAGDPFPDVQGTLAHELFWLRSWTNETYLWNTEVTDQNPNNFNNRVTYFNTLKTNALATSGKPKDQFHFSIATADYLAQILSAPTASYGAEIVIFSGSVPRDVRVLYTWAGTPATDLVAGTPKLTRGTRLLTVDGVDLVNGGTTQAQIDTLNNGTFPRTAGEAHTLGVRYPDGTERTITINSANLSEPPVNRTSVIPTATGNVGYIVLNTFSPFSTETQLVSAIASLNTQGVTDVVLDLRYNGGGLLAVASQLTYMIAGPTRTAGKYFERLQFNAASGTTNPVTGQPNNPTPFYSTGLGFSVTAGTPIQNLNLPRVFVISTDDTCSASESIINGLRGIDVEVILIGGTTCGKPYGFYGTDNCGQTYFSVQFQGLNYKNFGDYPDGFAAANTINPNANFAVKIPGCAVLDDLTRELGNASEGMLAAALDYRATGTCPAPVASALSPQRVRDDSLPMQTSGRSEAAEILRNNRDLRMPGQQ